MVGGMSLRNTAVATPCEFPSPAFAYAGGRWISESNLLLINMLVSQNNRSDASILAQFLRNMTLGILL